MSKISFTRAMRTVLADRDCHIDDSDNLTIVEVESAYYIYVTKKSIEFDVDLWDELSVALVLANMK